MIPEKGKRTINHRSVEPEKKAAKGSNNGV
jgi:hypothetical protein